MPISDNLDPTDTMRGTPKRRSSTKQKFTQEVKNDPDTDLGNSFNSIEASDTADESDVSEYGKGRKKRLVKKKPKHTSIMTDVTRTPDLPTMSDIEYDRDWSSPELGACAKARRPNTPKEGVSRASRLAVQSRDKGVTSVSSGIPGIVQIHVNAGAAAGGTTINLDLSDLVLGKRTFDEIGSASLPTPDGSEGSVSPTRIVINKKTGQIRSATPVSSNKHRRMLEDADARAGLDQQSKKGFCDIPFELRVRIYRQVFVTETPIDFASRANFARSSAFLRTCQVVHHEGRAVLYGENAFHFERSQGIRGTFFESTWKEIGFKDARRFLETIGTANISRMRYASFHFQDAAPSTAHHLDENERRFVNDPVLHHLLKLIGAHAHLAKIAFQFSGRKQLQKFDYNFLQSLSSIKSEEVIHAERMTYATSKAGDEEIVDKLQKVMTVPRADQTEISVGKKKGPTVKMLHERPMPSSYYGGGW